MLQILGSAREEKEVVDEAEVVAVMVEMTLIDSAKNGDHHQEDGRHPPATTGVGPLPDVG